MKLLLPMNSYFIEFGTCKYRHSLRTVIELNKLAYRSITWIFVLNVKSLKNLAPALSSMEFSFKFKYYKVVLSLIA